MVSKDQLDSNIIKDLGDGLVLRRSTRDDAGALSDFNAKIQSDEGPDQPLEGVAIWTRDLLERPHPTFNQDEFTIVEDISTGEIVSSLNLISQTWAYGGIEFGVGRSELVGTHPDFRNLGLVRAQYEVIHEWSADKGEMVQAITGIPFFYRQFGYEMALNLGGGRAGYLPDIPKLKDEEEEPYIVRPATEADLEFIDRLYQQANQRNLVSCVWDKDLWLYELKGKSAKNINRSALRIIETPGVEVVGFLAHPHNNWYRGTMLPATAFEVKPGVSWSSVTHTVIRYLEAAGKAYAAQEKKEEFGSFGFWLGSQHPVYDVIPGRLPRIRKPYAWYLRVPDLVGFLQHVSPVLEKRLAQSTFVGHTGELRITYYRDGLKLVFKDGSVKVKAWEPTPHGHSGEAAFPNQTFLQLLFGYRSLDELNDAYADCWYKHDEAYGLLNIMFPKQASNVWPIS